MARPPFPLALALTLLLALPALAAPRVRLSLSDGGVVEGELAAFEDGVYTVTVAGQRLELREADVARVEFVSAADPKAARDGQAAEPAAQDLSKFFAHRPRSGARVEARESRDLQVGERRQRQVIEWVDQVQESERSGRLVRFVRTYRQFDIDDRPAAPLGAPIAIRLRGATWDLQTREGAVPQALRDHLDGLRQAAPFDQGSWRPGRAVRPGERWDLSPEAIGLLVGEEQASGLDDVLGKGTLIGVAHDGEGRQVATVSFEVTGRCRTLGGLDMGGAPFRALIRWRGPLDGSTPDLEEEVELTVGDDLRAVASVVQRPAR